MNLIDITAYSAFVNASYAVCAIALILMVASSLWKRRQAARWLARETAPLERHES